MYNFNGDLGQKLLEFVNENKHISEEALNDYRLWAMTHFEDENAFFQFEIELEEYLNTNGYVIDTPSAGMIAEIIKNRTLDSINDYINYYTNFPILTDAEAISLLTQLKNDPENEEAKEALLFSNARALLVYAKDKTKYGIDVSDIMHEGFIGILEALKSFDISKGHYSQFCITRAIHSMYKYITDNLSPFTISEATRRRKDFLIKFAIEYQQEFSKPLDVFPARCAVVAEEMRQNNRAQKEKHFTSGVIISYKTIRDFIQDFDDKKQVLGVDKIEHDNKHTLTANTELAEAIIKEKKYTLEENGEERLLNKQDIKTIFTSFDRFSVVNCKETMSNISTISLDDPITSGSEQSENSRSVAEIISDKTGSSFETYIEEIDVIDDYKAAGIRFIETVIADAEKNDKSLKANKKISNTDLAKFFFGFLTPADFKRITGFTLNPETGIPDNCPELAYNETAFLGKKFPELWTKNAKGPVTGLNLSINDPTEIDRIAKLPVWSIEYEVNKRLTPSQKQKFETAVSKAKNTNFYIGLQLDFYKYKYLALMGEGRTQDEITRSKNAAVRDLRKLTSVFAEFKIPVPQEDFLGSFVFLDVKSRNKVLERLSDRQKTDLVKLPRYEHSYTEIDGKRMADGYLFKTTKIEEIGTFLGIAPATVSQQLNYLNRELQIEDGLNAIFKDKTGLSPNNYFSPEQTER